MFHASVQVTGRVRHSSGLAFGDDAATLDLASHFDFMNGTGSNQAQQEFTDTRTLAGSANEDLDLNGGTTLKDSLGANLVFTAIRLLMVSADAANASTIVLSPSASVGMMGPFGGTSPTISIPPGGMALLIAPLAGWSVTPSTAHKINVANASGSSAKYSIWAIGS